MLGSRRRGCSEPMQLLSKSDLSKDTGHAAVALSEWSSHLLITVSAVSCPSLIVLAFAWTVGSTQIKGKPLPFPSYVGGIAPGTTCPHGFTRTPLGKSTRQRTAPD